MIDSVALEDDIADMGIPDFAGNTVDSHGQTVTFKSSGKLKSCKNALSVVGVSNEPRHHAHKNFRRFVQTGNA